MRRYTVTVTGNNGNRAQHEVSARSLNEAEQQISDRYEDQGDLHLVAEISADFAW